MKNHYFKKFLFIIGLITCSFASSQEISSFFTKSDVFFKENIVDGRVDYKKIKTSPTQLNELVMLASKVEVLKTKSNQYRAFWINAYNVTVIKSVIKEYPIKSPLDISGFFDKKTHEIAGKQITLNDIENKLLRAQFNNDPRFHFVLVCAGLGCPPLINEVYLPKTLEAQLDKQTTLALNNPDFIKANNKKNKVQISQIFEWYTSDFTTNNKSLIDFINTYRREEIPNTNKLSYYIYDWNLNETE